MPRLKRLLRPEQLGDAPANATAEQLFASSLYTQEMRSQRQQAAAMCSTSLVSMASLKRQDDSSDELRNALERVGNCSIEQCVETALLVAKEEKHVLFLVRDSKMVAKRLAAAVSRPDAAMTTDTAAECLHRVHFRLSRSVYDLLSELERVQQRWKEEQLRLVVIGPLCELFSSFQTAAGITTTGAGLKRMVELAIQRLQAMTSVRVSVLEPDTT